MYSDLYTITILIYILYYIQKYILELSADLTIAPLECYLPEKSVTKFSLMAKYIN